MRLDPLKLLCFMCLAFELPSHATGDYHSKNDYIQLALKNKFPNHPAASKHHNQQEHYNHHSYHKRHSHHHSHHTTSTTTEKPETRYGHLSFRHKHSKFPRLDGVMNRLDQIKTTTEKSMPVIGKSRPTIEKSRPTTEKVRPITEKVRPIMEKMRPITEKIRPITEKIRPITEKSTPTMDKFRPWDKFSPAEKHRTTTTPSSLDELDNEALTEEDYEEMDYADKFDDSENNIFDELDDGQWEDDTTDLDEEDYLNEDLNNLDDDGLDNEDLDNENLDENEEIEDVHFDMGYQGYQAEEATRAPSPYTQYKWTHYGTKDSVDSARNKLLFHSRPSTPKESAMEHFERMAEARCNRPLPRVIQVQSVHPNPGKTYMPHCTVLHRCGEDTGCCPGSDKRCGPKDTEFVQLYFLTTQVNSRGSQQVETLLFENHTKCECLNKDTNSIAWDQESLRVPRSQFSMRCKCPETFTAQIKHNMCSCDCAEGNYDCSRMKKGKEFFSLTDRSRILNGQVSTPKCEYGIYMRSTGRCPRKQDKFDMFASVPAN